jgi:pentatricopeptide repeat protein
LKNQDVPIFEVYYEHTEDYLTDINTKMKEKISLKHYHLAHQIYKDLVEGQFAPNHQLALTMLSLLIKEDRFSDALAYYKSFIKDKLKPNKYLYSQLILLYSGLKQPDKGFELLKEMADHYIRPDIYHYCQIIEGFKANEQFD